MSLERTERQLVELSVDPWRCWVSFLVMVTLAMSVDGAQRTGVDVDVDVDVGLGLGGQVEGGLQPQKSL